jgi:AMMECR1 domain-containing protein
MMIPVILDEIACRICGMQYDEGEKSLKYLESVKDCFGVFVSVKKGHDIYGCLGSWSDNILDKDRLYYMIMHLCQSIMNGEDPRSIERLAVPFTVEISFMILPLIPAVPDSDFDNEKYGLMVLCGGKRATFLPKVYGNISWDVISTCLMKKAGIDEKNEEVLFNAYDAICVSKDFVVV